MTTLKPSENKREEFRRYLERTGVMDALTKVLVSLYEQVERPEDALEFIRNRLSDQPNKDVESLKEQLEKAMETIDMLTQENAKLKGESPRSDEPPATDEPQPEEAP